VRTVDRLAISLMASLELFPHQSTLPLCLYIDQWRASCSTEHDQVFPAAGGLGRDPSRPDGGCGDIPARAAADRQKIAILQGELRKADERLSKIYEAVESGILPLDGTLQRRVQLAKASRENVLIEIAGLRRRQPRQRDHFRKQCQTNEIGGR
jgi:hypothetical protein